MYLLSKICIFDEHRMTSYTKKNLVGFRNIHLFHISKLKHDGEKFCLNIIVAGFMTIMEETSTWHSMLMTILLEPRYPDLQ